MYLLKFTVGLILFAVISFAAMCYFSPKFFMKTVYAVVKLKLGDVPEISNAALYQLTNNADLASTEKIVLVDVRTEHEKQVSMIPGAIDRNYFEQYLGDYRHQQIIVYCTIGYRSGFYTQTLREKGIDAYNLSEGILGWTHLDGPLLDSQQEPTKQVHVYSRPWNLGVKDYIAVF